MYFGYKAAMRAIDVPSLRLPLLLYFWSLAQSGAMLAAEEESKLLTFSLQERIRGERRENTTDFDKGTLSLTDDEWLVQRLRLGVHWEAAPWFRLMVEGQDTREFFSDRPNEIGKLGAEGDDAFDLRQGFVEFGNPESLSFRAGRQVLVYGD